MKKTLTSARPRITLVLQSSKRKHEMSIDAMTTEELETFIAEAKAEILERISQAPNLFYGIDLGITL